MNERVKELAQQVGISYDYLNNTKQWVLIEALAELIVRECADKVDWILAEGGKTQGDLIKKHFGVE